MEQKPHKKEELMIANSVLKLAENLIKVSTLCGCWHVGKDVYLYCDLMVECCFSCCTNTLYSSVVSL